jgi:hypothetical protein
MNTGLLSSAHCYARNRPSQKAVWQHAEQHGHGRCGQKFDLTGNGPLKRAIQQESYRCDCTGGRPCTLNTLTPLTRFKGK